MHSSRMRTVRCSGRRRRGVAAREGFCPGGCIPACTEADAPPAMALFIFTARKRSLGQGNIFTPVCHSVHRGGGLPQCMLGYHPTTAGTRHIPWSRHPPDQAPPTPPGTRHPPGPGTLPPGAEHAGRYGQRAGGSHPTGMQSCLT